MDFGSDRIWREDLVDFRKVAGGGDCHDGDRSPAIVDDFEVSFLAGLLGDVFAAEGNPLPFVAGLDILPHAAEKEAIEATHEVSVDDELDLGISFDVEVNAVAGDLESGRAENSVEFVAVAAAIVDRMFGGGILDGIPGEGGEIGITKGVAGGEPTGVGGEKEPVGKFGGRCRRGGEVFTFLVSGGGDFVDLGNSGRDFATGILFVFVSAGALEEAGEGVVVGGGDGVEFMVVAAGAGDREAEEGFGKGIDHVVDAVGLVQSHVGGGVDGFTEIPEAGSDD